MGNRKQPFGYKMERGEVVPHPQESEVVQYIFQQYSSGATFNSLVSELRKQNIPYDEGKIWNKNMVARILEDSRYIGEKEFPAIIDREIFELAKAHRADKQKPIHKTEAEKVLRQLSGQTATAELAACVLRLLNRLITDPSLIQLQPSKRTDTAESILALELDQIMSCQPIDEDKAKILIFAIASEQYSHIGDSEYETERLLRLFSRIQPMTELDASLMKSALASIQVRANKTVSLRLKNGQTIE